MSFTITVRVFQTNPNAFFRIAEKTIFTKGNWSESSGEHVLFMTPSGTSGTLRFLSDTGENFIVALGVHDNNRWCDIVTDLTDEQTGVVIHPQYYVGNRTAQREKTLSTFNISNAKGRNFAVNFTVAVGNTLKANIIIG